MRPSNINALFGLTAVSLASSTAADFLLPRDSFPGIQATYQNLLQRELLYSLPDSASLFARGIDDPSPSEPVRRGDPPKPDPSKPSDKPVDSPKRNAAKPSDKSVGGEPTKSDAAKPSDKPGGDAAESDAAKPTDAPKPSNVPKGAFGSPLTASIPSFWIAAATEAPRPTDGPKAAASTPGGPTPTGKPGDTSGDKSPDPKADGNKPPNDQGSKAAQRLVNTGNSKKQKKTRCNIQHRRQDTYLALLRRDGDGGDGDGGGNDGGGGGGRDDGGGGGEGDGGGGGQGGSGDNGGSGEEGGGDGGGDDGESPSEHHRKLAAAAKKHLEAWKTKEGTALDDQSNYRQNEYGGWDYKNQCLCGCSAEDDDSGDGNSRRGYGFEKREPVDIWTRDETAMLQPGCSVLQHDNTGEHFYKGDCSQSTIGNKPLTDAMKPAPQRRRSFDMWTRNEIAVLQPGCLILQKDGTGEHFFEGDCDQSTIGNKPLSDVMNPAPVKRSTAKVWTRDETAVLQPGCSILQHDGTRDHFSTGDCGQSTIGNRPLADVMKPAPQKRKNVFIPGAEAVRPPACSNVQVFDAYNRFLNGKGDCSPRSPEQGSD